MLWRSLLHKEYRLLATPAFFAALTASWLTLGLYLASGLVEYQAIAPKLAGLENRRGATETLLGSATQLLQWLMILWSIYFGARSLAGERIWHTDVLLRGVRGGAWRLLLTKTVVLLAALAPCRSGCSPPGWRAPALGIVACCWRSSSHKRSSQRMPPCWR